jgi:hypothetical protein
VDAASLPDLKGPPGIRLNLERTKETAQAGRGARPRQAALGHAKQFKRANRALGTIRTYLGRVCRDLVRKTGDDAQLRKIFAQALSLAFAVREQRQHQRGRKIYSLHAPEVECIGKGSRHPGRRMAAICGYRWRSLRHPDARFQDFGEPSQH